LVVIALMVRRALVVPAIEVNGIVTQSVLSGDGKRVVIEYISKPSPGMRYRSYTLSEWDVATRQLNWERPEPGPMGDLSPSGAWMLEKNSNLLSVKETTTGRLLSSWNDDPNRYTGYLWPNDDNWLLRTGNSPALRQHEQGKLVRTLPRTQWFQGARGLRLLSISRDGKYAAALEEGVLHANNPNSTKRSYSGTGRLAVVSWPAGKKLFEAPGDLYNRVAWTIDNHYLVALTGVMSGGVHVQISIAKINLAAGKTQWGHLPVIAPDETSTLLNDWARLAPDGRFVAIPYSGTGFAVYSAADGSVKLNVVPKKGANSWYFIPLQFAPDSRFIARVANNRVEFFNLSQN
jgi:hypothetical protein